MENERRRFLAATAVLGVGTLAHSPGQAGSDDKAKDDKKAQPEEEVSAAEDLMRFCGEPARSHEATGDTSYVDRA